MTERSQEKRNDDVAPTREDARLDDVAIIPLCPFAKAQIGRHPEWQDVLRR